MYRGLLRNDGIMLGDHAKLNHVIRNMTLITREYSIGEGYVVLVILTNGQITDMRKTKKVKTVHWRSVC